MLTIYHCCNLRIGNLTFDRDHDIVVGVTCASFSLTTITSSDKSRLLDALTLLYLTPSTLLYCSWTAGCNVHRLVVELFRAVHL